MPRRAGSPRGFGSYADSRRSDAVAVNGPVKTHSSPAVVRSESIRRAVAPIYMLSRCGGRLGVGLTRCQSSAIWLMTLGMRVRKVPGCMHLNLLSRTWYVVAQKASHVRYLSQTGIMEAAWLPLSDIFMGCIHESAAWSWHGGRWRSCTGTNSTSSPPGITRGKEG